MEAAEEEGAGRVTWGGVLATVLAEDGVAMLAMEFEAVFDFVADVGIALPFVPDGIARRRGEPAGIFERTGRQARLGMGMLPVAKLADGGDVEWLATEGLLEGGVEAMGEVGCGPCPQRVGDDESTGGGIKELIGIEDRNGPSTMIRLRGLEDVPEQAVDPAGIKRARMNTQLAGDVFPWFAWAFDCHGLAERAEERRGERNGMGKVFAVLLRVVGAGDASIRSANGEAPGAGRSLEEGEVASREPAGEFGRVGEELGVDDSPGGEEGAFDRVHGEIRSGTL